jgi:DNA-binding LacI/PurR family transcriptional regulator
MRNPEERLRRAPLAESEDEQVHSNGVGLDRPVRSPLDDDSGSVLPSRPKRADRPGGRGVNLRDVAEAASVSVATVSMVLNNNPRISRATHARVQRVMEKLGYQPNRLAQSLSSKYTNCLAVLLPDVRHAFADAYFGELLSGISDRASKLGYKIMLEHAKPDFIDSRKHLEIFDRRFVDGVLCLGTNDNNEFLADFDPDSYPALIVDNAPEVEGAPRSYKLDHVMCDYESGANQAMNYLIQLGHRQIGLIMAAPEIATSRRVREVFKQKLAAVGVDAPDSWIVDGQFTEEGGAEACRVLLAAHKDMTALLAGNDKMAIGAMHLMNRMGIDVPKDVSVVGFDDLRHAAFVNPSLTTVHLPLYQVGALATDRLIERIHGRREPVAEQLNTHLVVRDSTAMARTATRGAFEDSD